MGGSGGGLGATGWSLAWVAGLLLCIDEQHPSVHGLWKHPLSGWPFACPVSERVFDLMFVICVDGISS